MSSSRQPDHVLTCNAAVRHMTVSRCVWVMGERMCGRWTLVAEDRSWCKTAHPLIWLARRQWPGGKTIRYLGGISTMVKCSHGRIDTTFLQVSFECLIMEKSKGSKDSQKGPKIWGESDAPNSQKVQRFQCWGSKAQTRSKCHNFRVWVQKWSKTATLGLTSDPNNQKDGE